MRELADAVLPMRVGVLKLKVRKAMEGYLRDRLGLAMAGGKPALKLLE